MIDPIESWGKVLQQAISDQEEWEQQAQTIDPSIPAQDYTGLSVDTGTYRASVWSGYRTCLVVWWARYPD